MLIKSGIDNLSRLMVVIRSRPLPKSKERFLLRVFYESCIVLPVLYSACFAACVKTFISFERKNSLK
jgi:hypothetical protein